MLFKPLLSPQARPSCTILRARGVELLAAEQRWTTASSCTLPPANRKRAVIRRTEPSTVPIIACSTQNKQRGRAAPCRTLPRPSMGCPRLNPDKSRCPTRCGNRDKAKRLPPASARVSPPRARSPQQRHRHARCPRGRRRNERLSLLELDPRASARGRARASSHIILYDFSFT